MNAITIDKVLPHVFRGMEEEPRLRDSQVWLAQLTLTRGCRVCIAAESGGGKSSLLSFVCGERDDYNGLISFDGRDIRSLSVNQWCDVRMQHLALLPQEMRLFGELTVMENIELKNRLTRHRTTSQIMTMLDELGIASKADSPASRLSVGQQQRVALVRALCQPFDFIMLDEPVSHLDETNNRIAAAMVEREAESAGAGIIATSVGNPLLLTAPTVIRL
ncbi:MAG: ATP-binding cassette domain-containing protein [Muribaculaceae bacterium]|nr:ATP-binding cassette domain-containing protein [Muribaculaceae bacterium]